MFQYCAVMSAIMYSLCKKLFRTALKWNKLHKSCKKNLGTLNRNHSGGTSYTRHVVPEAVYKNILSIRMQQTTCTQ